MANLEHVEILMRGVDAWNEWRQRNLSTLPDLVGADLRGSQLDHVNFHNADLDRADLSHASLRKADLENALVRQVNLTQANLSDTRLGDSQFVAARLVHANLVRVRGFNANFLNADLSNANLSHAFLPESRFYGASLDDADLTETTLNWSNLCNSSLRRAKLTETFLLSALLVGADLCGAVLSRTYIYGVSAWDLKINSDTQQDRLIVSKPTEPRITVDSIEVAQFVNLLLRNEKIRDVIDTVTSKMVLILGRFSPERKPVLDAIREELRLRGYVPVLFDFDVPAGRDITETVTLLARMARFIIADLTDPSSIPKELEAIVPQLAVPVQPLLDGHRPYAMFKDYWKYDWVLPVHRYDGLNSLLATLADKVIVPAETMTNALAEKRRRFEAELIQPR
jgi:hypothetical protein